MLVRSGNFLTDISNHLPNFTVLIKALQKPTQARPKVRIFSKKKYFELSEYVRVCELEPSFCTR